jgi:aspartyl/glutamyl-tRNA(Asn/Gln) amidotransferase C subunit
VSNILEMNDLKSLVKLSKLQFTDEELAKLQGEFSQMIDFADSINQMVEGDTSALKEVGAATIAYQDLRSDEVEPSLDSEKILSNVQAENGYFAVKRVVK